MKRTTLLILLVFFFVQATAQQPSQELEMKIESLAEGNESNETDLMQIAENLQQLKDHPIPLNFATIDELERLPYLNIFHLNNLLQYRERTGLIYTPYELMAVKGFDREIIERILPYLSFQTRLSRPELQLKNVARYSRHDVMLRASQVLEERAGYADSNENGYLGDPQNLYLRYKGTYRNYLSIGLVAQHDPGEPFGKPHQKAGIDFLSAHAALLDYGNLRKLIIGDYQAEFGQGMAFWSSLAFGKSAQAAEVKRYAQGFRPFTGSEENRFLRGMAATYRFGQLDVSAFYSRNRIDANREITDTLDTYTSVSSLQTTGLHRTANEMEDKDANRLRIIGTHLGYRIKRLALGITAVHHSLETPLQEATELYRKYLFHGRELSNLSADANWMFRNINFFGELAVSGNQKAAGVVGVQSNPADGFYLTLLHRSMDKAYQALYNAPFAESGNYGERGTYLGIQWQLNATFLLKSYADIYRFDWLRFRVNAPSQGRDLLAQLEMYFNRYCSAYARLKSETRQVNSDHETTVRQLSNQSKTTLRFHLSSQLNNQVRLASRAEYARFSQDERDDRGFMAFQDVKYTFRKMPLTLTSRFAVIETDSYDARIYAYENDVIYSFSIPPYYGRSTRFYLLAGYDLGEKVKLQARYALSRFYDREEISSGLQLIEGNRISELKLLLRFKF